MTEFNMFLVLALIAALAVVARWTRQPYPIVFLLGGIALAFVPGMPVIELAPDLVFLVFLPPLIFGDAYTTDWRRFKRYLKPITALATGLVVVTSVSVAFVAHWVIGLPLDVGFVLGAILSPTDTVATDAIAEETHMPLPLMTILGGESLINDATGLVLYKFAVAAVMIGTFSLGTALAQFVYVALVGVAVGLAGGFLGNRITRFLFERDLTDDVISVTITLVTPFLVYLAADRLGASGVLAAAAGGMYLSQKGGGMYTPQARLVGRSVWNTLFFVFNGALFIILGLQLRAIFAELAIFPAATLAQYAAAIAGTVIAVRLIWVFGEWALRRRTSVAWAFVVGWSGMRGIVALAAALSIPDNVAGGAPFPARDLILFITFAVILVTLLGQGLSLPWLVRGLGVVDADAGDQPRARANVRVAQAALGRLVELEPSFVSAAHWEVAGRLRARYEEQLAHFHARVDGSEHGDAVQHDLERQLVRQTIDAERATLDDMRHAGEIGDEVFRRLQYEIDLAESRLLAD
ncbi:MAG TPA: Na+/H+ antiporter [Candidatus Lustribacter sp.]|nr:Na+/H+ antiporter [Candidatus Lustribacter sp.]